MEDDRKWMLEKKNLFRDPTNRLLGTASSLVPDKRIAHLEKV